MTTFIDMMTEKDALTKNGALTNSTSHNFNLDLFFLAGACRTEDEKSIENLLVKSYEQDRLKTLKIIFWAGDIRQGAGERRFFKLALNWLNKNHSDDIQNNVNLIPEFSRWDVVFDLAMENEFVFSYLLKCLVQKDTNYPLLCKWLPRKSVVTDKKKKTIKENGKEITIVEKTKRTLHNGIAKKIQKRLGINEKAYRKMLVQGTKVVEQQMCAKKWNEIEYSKIPSVAMNKYNKAWYRHDPIRFEQYLEDVKSGKTKMNASVIFPSDIIRSAISQSDCSWDWEDCELNDAQITQWNSLPNYLENAEFNSFIPVCDVSGSMQGNPIAVSLGLGLYLSERNVGQFKDAFITFSRDPQLQYLKGNINERLHQLASSAWGMNTNLTAVFRLILQKALDSNLPQDQMPKNILIISDMEFDRATHNSGFSQTTYETIREAYHTVGYNCPNIIFWNVNGRVGNVPVTVNDSGVALISGSSPNIIKSVLTNEISPVKIMNNVIESERYSVVK